MQDPTEHQVKLEHFEHCKAQLKELCLDKQSLETPLLPLFEGIIASGEGQHLSFDSLNLLMRCLDEEAPIDSILEICNARVLHWLSHYAKYLHTLPDPKLRSVCQGIVNGASNALMLTGYMHSIPESLLRSKKAVQYLNHCAEAEVRFDDCIGVIKYLAVVYRFAHEKDLEHKLLSLPPASLCHHHWTITAAYVFGIEIGSDLQNWHILGELALSWLVENSVTPLESVRDVLTKIWPKPFTISFFSCVIKHIDPLSLTPPQIAQLQRLLTHIHSDPPYEWELFTQIVFKEGKKAESWQWIEMLSNLDHRYFDEPGMFHYLKRCCSSIFTLEIIQKLNENADRIYNKCRNCDNISKIIDLLSDRFFEITPFWLDIFANLPDDWLNSPDLIAFLNESISLIAPQLSKGMTMSQAAVESSASPQMIINIFTKSVWSKIFGAGKKDRLGIFSTAMANLSSHVEDPENARKLFAAADIHFLKTMTTDDLDAWAATSTLTLSQYGAWHSHLSEAQTVSNEVRLWFKRKVKATWLEALQMKVPQFEALHLVCDGIVAQFRTSLDSYKATRNITETLNSDNTLLAAVPRFSTTGSGRLIAYAAFRQALNNKELAFVELRKVIADEKMSENIGLTGVAELAKMSHAFQEATISEADAVKRTDFEEALDELHATCLDDDLTMVFCLLDDLFYHLLDSTDLLAFSKGHPEAFKQVMLAYRPTEYKKFLAFERAADAERLRQASSASASSSSDSSKELPDTTLQIPSPLKGIENSEDKDEQEDEDSSSEETPPKEEAISKPAEPPIVVPPPVVESSRSIFTSFKSAMGFNRLTRKPMDSGYQLQDPDLIVGLNYLRQLITQNKADQYVILPTNVLSNLQKDHRAYDYAIANYKEKICFEVLNVDGNHWVAHFFYVDKNGVSQSLVLDPSFSDGYSKNSRRNELQRVFSSIYPKHKLEIVIDISQQLNDTDCGQACLQNGLDLIEKGVVSLQNGKLVLNRNDLTVVGERHIGQEQKFVQEIQGYRSTCAAVLKQFNKCAYFTSEGNTEFEIDYSYDMNVKMQPACNELQELASILSKHYEINRGNINQSALVDCIKRSGSLEDFHNGMAQLLQPMLVTHDALTDRYLKAVAVVNEAYAKNLASEVSGGHFKGTTPIIYLARYSYSRFKSVKCEEFRNGFLAYLEQKGLKVDRTTVLNSLADHYKDYLTAEGAKTQWIQDYYKSVDSKWDHLKELKSFLENYNPSSAVSAAPSTPASASRTQSSTSNGFSFLPGKSPFGSKSAPKTASTKPLAASAPAGEKPVPLKVPAPQSPVLNQGAQKSDPILQSPAPQTSAKLLARLGGGKNEQSDAAPEKKDNEQAPPASSVKSENQQSTMPTPEKSEKPAPAVNLSPEEQFAKRKETMENLFNTILTNLEPITSKDYVEANKPYIELAASCVRWKNWFKNNPDNAQFTNQAKFIFNHLIELLGEPLTNRSWEIDMSRIIREPLLVSLFTSKILNLDKSKNPNVWERLQKIAKERGYNEDGLSDLSLPPVEQQKDAASTPNPMSI